ncbi:MAG TPA: AraC family transcriptional regulator [Steroidobacteraceae bacterium]|nr:AraC family transcriptional regulator [Steroidobacteraceae bacterium]
MSLTIRRFHFAGALNGSVPPRSPTRDTEVHWIAAGRTRYEVDARVPSIHAAWHGRYSLIVDQRSVALDDDVFLVLNSGHTLSGGFRKAAAGRALGIYFSPELLAQAFASLGRNGDAILRQGADGDTERPLFFEHIRTRNRAIASVMRFIAHHLEHGIDQSLWYEEHVLLLLERMLRNEVDTGRQVAALARARERTRREMFQRVARVTDLIHCAYEQPLTLPELATAARWSMFHMLREFKAVHGLSPHEYLQRRRTEAAVRLLQTSDLAVAEIAERVGFDDRSTLIRRLRRYHGLGPRELRALARTEASVQAGWSARSEPLAAAT